MVEPEELVKLARAMNREKKAVTDWMRDQGKSGFLRVNSDAPNWNAYEDACKAFNAAVATIE